MPDLCRQISGPMDLRETAFSRGDATKGEAWTRFCRRLRTELGEDVFSYWFGCLELDALSGQHAHLSVPTKFLAIAHVLIPGGVGIGQELAWLRKFDSGIAS